MQSDNHTVNQKKKQKNEMEANKKTHSYIFHVKSVIQLQRYIIIIIIVIVIILFAHKIQS